MPKIVLTDITKRWDNFYAVDHLDLTIEDQAFVTLLGRLRQDHHAAHDRRTGNADLRPHHDR